MDVPSTLQETALHVGQVARAIEDSTPVICVLAASIAGQIQWSKEVVVFYRRSEVVLIGSDVVYSKDGLFVRSVHRTLGCIARSSDSQGSAGSRVYYSLETIQPNDQAAGGNREVYANQRIDQRSAVSDHFAREIACVIGVDPSENSWQRVCIKLPKTSTSDLRVRKALIASAACARHCYSQVNSFGTDGFMPIEECVSLSAPRGNIAIVMEYCGDTLLETLSSNHEQRPTAHPPTPLINTLGVFTKSIMVECLQQMLRMHACNVVHLDVHLDNIVTRPSGTDSVFVNLLDAQFRVAAPLNPLFIDLSRGEVLRGDRARIRDPHLVDLVERTFNMQVAGAPPFNLLKLVDLFMLARCAYRWAMDNPTSAHSVDSRWALDMMQKTKQLAHRAMTKGEHADYDAAVRFIVYRLKSTVPSHTVQA